MARFPGEAILLVVGAAACWQNPLAPSGSSTAALETSGGSSTAASGNGGGSGASTGAPASGGGSSAGAQATGGGSGTGASGTSTGAALSGTYDVRVSVATLSFAALGDTRPTKTCKRTSDCDYPSALIGRVFQQIQALSPPVSLVTITGDYQYNSPGAGTADWQVLQQYLPAAQQFEGPIYAAMGNHECDGWSDSNCLPGGPSPCDSNDACGITENLAAFESMLRSLGLPGSVPYYDVGVSIAGGLTAKFVVTAPNAWDSTQASWLQAALAQPTSYTFLVQHESNDLDESGASSPASLGSIRSIVQASGRSAAGEMYPVTLWIVGHTHNFDYDPTNQQVITGLGGAPTDRLENGEDASHFYSTETGAFMVCRQQSSGDPPALQCSLVDSQSDSVVGGECRWNVGDARVVVGGQSPGDGGARAESAGPWESGRRPATQHCRPAP
jgi:hypothetical protein